MKAARWSWVFKVILFAFDTKKLSWILKIGIRKMTTSPSLLSHHNLNSSGPLTLWNLAEQLVRCKISAQVSAVKYLREAVMWHICHDRWNLLWNFILWERGSVQMIHRSVNECWRDGRFIYEREQDYQSCMLTAQHSKLQRREHERKTNLSTIVVRNKHVIDVTLDPEFISTHNHSTHTRSTVLKGEWTCLTGKPAKKRCGTEREWKDFHGQ